MYRFAVCTSSEYRTTGGWGFTWKRQELGWMYTSWCVENWRRGEGMRWKGRNREGQGERKVRGLERQHGNTSTVITALQPNQQMDYTIKYTKTKRSSITSYMIGIHHLPSCTCLPLHAVRCSWRGLTGDTCGGSHRSYWRPRAGPAQGRGPWAASAPPPPSPCYECW